MGALSTFMKVLRPFSWVVVWASIRTKINFMTCDTLPGSTNIALRASIIIQTNIASYLVRK